MFMISIQNLYA